MRRANSLEKPSCGIRLKAGEGDDRIRSLDGITNSVDIRLSQLWEIVNDREAWRVADHGVADSQTQLSDRTTDFM